MNPTPGTATAAPGPVLVVDDIPMFRELLANFLAGTAEVISAANGNEALAVAHRVRPRLIVADLEMPGLDGAALCRAVREDARLSECHFLMILPGDDAHDRVRAIRAGADDVLSKPLQRVELVGAVSRFLADNAVRGLPRVSVHAPVTIYLARRPGRGRALNVSRGGIFVRTELPLPTRSEWRVRFQLPEMQEALTPTAMVVWRAEPSTPTGSGLGMRFVELDGQAARSLDEYVYERTPVVQSPPPGR